MEEQRASNHPLPNPLPPLEWLRVFAAAARSGSFTAAAAELNLTQAAVSQRIRNLEQRLGAALFLRLPRGVELTAKGDAYAPHVLAALAALERSTGDLFSAARKRLSIAASGSVTALWIAPRLPQIQRAFPALEVALITVQRQADYEPAGADLEVRFGDGAWPDCEALKLYDEVLAPLAAPGLLAAGTGDWRRLPQIALAGPRYGWNEWAAAAGVAPPRPASLRFDTFAQALAAAAAGAGVLLASLPLARNLIASGALLDLGAPKVAMTEGYWLTWRRSDDAFKERRHLLELLRAPSAGPAEHAL